MRHMLSIPSSSMSTKFREVVAEKGDRVRINSLCSIQLVICVINPLGLCGRTTHVDVKKNDEQIKWMFRPKARSGLQSLIQVFCHSPRKSVGEGPGGPFLKVVGKEILTK
jgi:hypothetical protein